MLDISNRFKILFEIYFKCRFWLFSCLASNLLSLLWDFEQYRTLCVSPAYNNNIMVNFDSEIWSKKEKSVSTLPLPNWWLDRHSRKKWFCVRDPDFWKYFSEFSKVFFRIFWSIFPNFPKYFSEFSKVFFRIFSIFPNFFPEFEWGPFFFFFC